MVPVIDAQLACGYDSGNGFRDAFAKILVKAPVESGQVKLLNASWIDTKLGPMIAVADENYLYLLEFADRRGLENEIKRLRQKTSSAIIPGETSKISLLKDELDKYFRGELKKFSVPICFLGSSFQKRVWEQLLKIPVGATCSYQEIAKLINNPMAYRAVANANGANQLAIIIPCHRVIQSDGKIGGYGGGVARKEWLLNHERNFN